MGLLLLRAAVGAALAVWGAIHVGDLQSAEPWMRAVGVAELGVAVALLIGFATPIAGALAVSVAVGVALTAARAVSAVEYDDLIVPIIVAVVATSVVLLGPGAFSLDARLFGRREILIPRASRPPAS
jgi:uncharacterized membrane protein YphA (DoxX/SURF4 family)